MTMRPDNARLRKATTRTPSTITRPPQHTHTNTFPDLNPLHKQPFMGPSGRRHRIYFFLIREAFAAGRRPTRTSAFRRPTVHCKRQQHENDYKKRHTPETKIASVDQHIIFHNNSYRSDLESIR